MMTMRISTVLLALALAASPALADRYWVTNGNGDYSDSNNWSDTSNGASGFSPPDLTTHEAFFDLTGAGAYTVSFTANGQSKATAVTNNLVTLDLNGFKYDIGEPTSGGHNLLINTTGAGSARLTLTDGTAALGSMPPGTGVHTLDFTRVQGASGSGGAKMVVDGSSAVFWSGQTTIGGIGGSNTTDSRLEVINGGTFHSISDAGVGGGSVLVSNNSLLTTYSFSAGAANPAAVDVTSGGTIRTRSEAGFGAGNFRIGFVGTLTLDNGAVELNGNAGGTLFQHGTLRGNGAIKRIAGATGLSEVRQDSYEGGNFSKIRPGDTSVTPAVGTLDIEDANLSFMTAGPAGNQQSIFFDLASPTSYDQILLTDPGTNDGTVTASLIGSLLFNNLNPINFTYATSMDLIRAEDIIDAGFTTPDLAAAAAGWTYNNGDPMWYSLDVVTVSPGNERLRLFVVPEPAGVVTLVAAISLMIRRRRR